MFTAESTQRFQGERRCARPGRPRAQVPWGARGAESLRVGAATKLEARTGRARLAALGPKFPAAAAARDPPPPLGAGEETRERVFQWSPREVKRPGSFGEPSS